MALNLTVQFEEPQWNSQPMWKLPSWAEPAVVACILIGSMILTRRKGFRIFDSRRQQHHYGLLDEDLDSARSSGDLSEEDFDAMGDDVSVDSISTTKRPSKKRSCFGAPIYTPNTARFANHYHSRILQRFPFLIEMFYWILTYTFYRMTRVLSEATFSKTAIWDVAEDHALAILEFEEFSWLSFLWPIREQEVQQWFLQGHQSFLTALNRSYALIHIPGTVGFIAWYYYVAPSHSTFAVVRRTMTLTNLFAFIVFILYPCMPPRLLPKEYGFLDTVRHSNGESVWMNGNYVNSLAAMPSMHFGYSFCVGCTMIYHSGMFRKTLEAGEKAKSISWSLFYVLFGIAYPSWILIAIVATGNHYYLDACVAFFVVILAFLCNKVFLALLPVEDLLLWCLRMEKPIPTTGDRFRERPRGL